MIPESVVERCHTPSLESFEPMRVTIVALNALPVVDPSEGRGIGGLETFAWRLACGLSKYSADSVQFVVRSRHKRATAVSEGVRIDCIHEPLREIRQCVSQSILIDSSRRLPLLKKWRASLLWQFPLLAANKLFFPAFSEQQVLQRTIAEFAPELIVTLGVNQTSSILADLASQWTVPIVLWLQSNADLDQRLYREEGFVDRYGVQGFHAKFCLRECRNIICQTDTQMQLLQAVGADCPANDGQSGRVVVIPNPIDLPAYDADSLSWSTREGVLWVGRADRFHKRPLLAIEIAKLCPSINFKLIVNPGDVEVLQEIKRIQPSNVTVLDYVPVNEMPDVLRKSRLFLSTGSSEYEGFPNVLLESSVSGTPIVSLEDFDSYLERSRGGVCVSGNIERAAQIIHRLHGGSMEWSELSTNAVKYVAKHHSLQHVIAKFQDWRRQHISRST